MFAFEAFSMTGMISVAEGAIVVGERCCRFLFYALLSSYGLYIDEKRHKCDTQTSSQLTLCCKLFRVYTDNGLRMIPLQRLEMMEARVTLCRIQHSRATREHPTSAGSE